MAFEQFLKICNLKGRSVVFKTRNLFLSSSAKSSKSFVPFRKVKVTTRTLDFDMKQQPSEVTTRRTRLVDGDRHPHPPHHTAGLPRARVEQVTYWTTGLLSIVPLPYPYIHVFLFILVPYIRGYHTTRTDYVFLVNSQKGHSRKGEGQSYLRF